MPTTSIAERIKSEIAEEDVGADLKKQIDEWLAADKDFNVWFLVTTKRQLADDDLMALLDGYRESQEIVEEAWTSFRDAKDAQALATSLTESLARMRALQARG